jgi:hypothetical protein
MEILGKVVIYAFFLIVAIPVALFVSGTFVDLSSSINGIPVESISEERARQLCAASDCRIEQTTSLLVGSNRVLTVTGPWLLYAAFLLTVVAFLVLAHFVIRWRLHLRDRRSTGEEVS